MKKNKIANKIMREPNALTWIRFWDLGGSFYLINRLDGIKWCKLILSLSIKYMKCRLNWKIHAYLELKCGWIGWMHYGNFTGEIRIKKKWDRWIPGYCNNLLINTNCN